MTTLDKKRSTVRKEVLFYEKDRPDPAVTMIHWKKRQFPRLKRSWRRQSLSLPGAASAALVEKCLA